ncbi:glycosyltransferase family 2 protein [Yersinia mollaretii]|uniref:glycosyltransferase family 2 protein n=1 Tax=Yersinia mollaretii TaxID=33060 RepID=UPI0011A5ECE2|nr:glycosyltransferase family 2 protein [Yersinia mollaretii]
MNKKLSIVIPCYERDTFLAEAIESVIPYKNICEIIVLDNASTNENIKKICGNYTDVLYIKNKKNLGLFGNWNKAFNVSRCEFVLILGDDDILLPSFIEGFYKTIEKRTQVDIYYSKFKCIDMLGKEIDYTFPYPLGDITKDAAIKYAVKNGFGLPTISMCYRKTLFSDNGFDEINFGSNDWFYLYGEMPWKYAYGSSDVGIYYRKHGDGISDKMSSTCTISIFILFHSISNGKLSIVYFKYFYSALLAYKKMKNESPFEKESYPDEFNKIINESSLLCITGFFIDTIFFSSIKKIKQWIKRLK